MAPTPARGSRGLADTAARLARAGARATRRRLVHFLGGSRRTRVIVVLACVLALSSADTATVGASAIELRHSLHINNTDVGLLVAVTSVVGAVFSLPFGALSDRVRRTTMLGLAVLAWGIGMIWSASASTFGGLLTARLFLGAVTAVAGPAIASLVGDWFPGDERGQIYSYILTGELLGAGLGFAVTGDIAALSWRAAFVILALPAFVLAWAVLRLPEPRRGGRSELAPDPGTRPWLAQRSAPVRDPGAPGATRAADSGYGVSARHVDSPPAAAPPWDVPPTSASGPAPALAGGGGSGPPTGTSGAAGAEVTDAQRLALARGIAPDVALVRKASSRLGFIDAVRFILSVRTNVALIVSGVCGYYFLAGVQTFGVEFVRNQYHVAPVVANLLLILVGAGAVVGVLVAGPLGDRLLRRGFLSGRVMVAAVAATMTVALFIPALAMSSALGALPYMVVAAATLSAQNPPIDAARLDIMPSWLWGRAEGVRTFVRTGAQALAPLLFGVFSDYVFGGGTNGLRWTFFVMLLPLSASAFYLFSAARRYPRDVATAAAAAEAAQAASAAGGPGGDEGGRRGRHPRRVREPRRRRLV